MSSETVKLSNAFLGIVAAGTPASALLSDVIPASAADIRQDLQTLSGSTPAQQEGPATNPSQVDRHISSPSVEANSAEPTRLVESSALPVLAGAPAEESAIAFSKDGIGLASHVEVVSLPELPVPFVNLSLQSFRQGQDGRIEAGAQHAALLQLSAKDDLTLHDLAMSSGTEASIVTSASRQGRQYREYYAQIAELQSPGTDQWSVQGTPTEIYLGADVDPHMTRQIDGMQLVSGNGERFIAMLTYDRVGGVAEPGRATTETMNHSLNFVNAANTDEWFSVDVRESLGMDLSRGAQIIRISDKIPGYPDGLLIVGSDENGRALVGLLKVDRSITDDVPVQVTPIEVPNADQWSLFWQVSEGGVAFKASTDDPHTTTLSGAALMYGTVLTDSQKQITTGAYEQVYPVAFGFNGEGVLEYTYAKKPLQGAITIETTESSQGAAQEVVATLPDEVFETWMPARLGDGAYVDVDLSSGDRRVFEPGQSQSTDFAVHLPLVIAGGETGEVPPVAVP